MSRPQASCAGCGESVDAPDSDLGRAVVAAFEEMHRKHCPCAACDPGLIIDGQPSGLPSRMSVCPDCGNKRCPKAANHARWQCSGSNTVGQVCVPVEGAGPASIWDDDAGEMVPMVPTATGGVIRNWRGLSSEPDPREHIIILNRKEPR